MQEHIATLIELQRFGYWSRFKIHAPGLAQMQPGQYMALHAALPGSYDPLRRLMLFPSNTDARTGTIDVLVAQNDPAHGFLASQPSNGPITLLGPIGHGWQLERAVRTVALAGTVAHAATLFGLAQVAVRRGCAVSLLLSAHEPNIPPPPFLLSADAEYNVTYGSDLAQTVLDQISDDTLRWADMLALALPIDHLATIAQRIWQTRLNWTEGMAQALLLPDPVCYVGVCGVCAVPTRQGYRLSCIDGPVFDLKQVAGYR